MIPPKDPVKTSVCFAGHQLVPMSCQQSMVQRLFHIWKDIPWNQDRNELENKHTEIFGFTLWDVNKNVIPQNSSCHNRLRSEYCWPALLYVSVFTVEGSSHHDPHGGRSLWYGPAGCGGKITWFLLGFRAWACLVLCPTSCFVWRLIWQADLRLLLFCSWARK